MSQPKNSPTLPKSIRHKQILQKAENDPDASMEEIAAEVPSATTEVVEDVLDEYGDPVAETSDTPDEVAPSIARGDDGPDLDDISEKQLETLHMIYEHPEASQRDLAELLDVTSPTVSNRVNSIEGFDWVDRETFASAIFDSDASVASPAVESNGTATVESPAVKSNGTTSDSENELEERVSELERRIDELAGRSDSPADFDELGLVPKVIHACMDSETITEDEELEILKAVLR